MDSVQLELEEAAVAWAEDEDEAPSNVIDLMTALKKSLGGPETPAKAPAKKAAKPAPAPKKAAPAKSTRKRA